MAKQLSREIWMVGAKRTAFGAFGGTLKELTATDLAVESARAAMAQSGVPPEQIEQVVFGNVQQTSADAIYLARHVGLTQKRLGELVRVAYVKVAEYQRRGLVHLHVVARLDRAMPDYRADQLRSPGGGTLCTV